MIDLEKMIVRRIEECQSESERYSRWLGILRVPNTVLTVGGSLLAFLGGATIIENSNTSLGGYMALVGGALTGLHNWFKCEAHQSDCKILMAKFESKMSSYQSLLVESDSTIKEQRFRELEKELSSIKESRSAKPWIKT